MALVVSLLADDLPTLHRSLEGAVREEAVLEVRLDRIGHPGREALRALRAAVPRPLIVTANGPEAHGTFRGTPADLVTLLRDAATAGANYVDVDHALAPALGEVAAPCRRIVSRHFPDGTPDDLAAVGADLRRVAGDGDLLKLVPHAARAEDGMRLLRWLRGEEGVIAFSSGAAGQFTRILAPAFGSPFTYAAPSGRPAAATAPGQLPADELRARWPSGPPRPATRVFGVVGNPVGHSLSPALWSKCFERLGLDAVYAAFEPDDLDAFLDLADDPAFHGFSITIPFKERALARAEVADEDAQRTGAANTLVRTKTGWRAANTDVEGVRGALANVDLPKFPRTLIVGAGGAARAAVVVARDLGGEVFVTGLRPERPRVLAADLGGRYVPWDEVGDLDFDLLIHATPVGMDPAPDDCLVPAAWLRPGMAVFDAVYRPARTRLYELAAERGCTRVSGIQWFMHQAEAQFRLLTGCEAPRGPFGHALARAMGWLPLG